MITNNSDILNIYEEVHEVPCDEDLEDLEDPVEVDDEDLEDLVEADDKDLVEVDDKDLEEDEQALRLVWD